MRAWEHGGSSSSLNTLISSSTPATTLTMASSTGVGGLRRHQDLSRGLEPETEVTDLDAKEARDEDSIDARGNQEFCPNSAQKNLGRSHSFKVSEHHHRHHNSPGASQEAVDEVIAMRRRMMKRRNSSRLEQQPIRILGFLAEGRSGRIAVATRYSDAWEAEDSKKADEELVDQQSIILQPNDLVSATQRLSLLSTSPKGAPSSSSLLAMRKVDRPPPVNTSITSNSDNNIPKSDTAAITNISDVQVFKLMPGAIPKSRSDKLLQITGSNVSLELLPQENSRIQEKCPFALKIIDLERKDTTGASSTEAYENEISIMRRLATVESASPFMVDFLFASYSHNRVYIGMGLCLGGDLFTLIRQEAFSPKEILFFAVEISLALQHLHNNRIIHGDLKPENVMLTNEGHVKIVDFGLSVQLDVNRHFNPETGRLEVVSHSGTLAYCAPEVLARFPHSFESDWWSYGVILYEMLCHCLPWMGSDDDETCAMICTAPLKPPEGLDYVEPRCFSFISQLLCKCPEKRIGFEGGLESIKQHEFFKSVNWDHAKNLRYRPPFKLLSG